MERKNIIDRQWLLAYSNRISPGCGETMSGLLSEMDGKGVQYEINFGIHTGELPDKIYYMGSLNFDLAITLDKGSKMLIKLEMPEEALDQMEDIPGYGMVPSKAYEWLLKYMLPEFDDEEADTLDRLSQKSEEERNADFQLRLKLLDANTRLSEEDRQRFLSMIESQINFFRMSEAEREKYFDSHKQKLDFDAMSKEERYDYLKAVDAILHPIIGDNGFPDWRDPGFIDRVLKK